MKLLDERGIGTVWSICKEKFALVGHTHNYAGSGSPGGSANSAIGVVDYNQTGKTIQIGYSGAGITGDQIKYIAGYTDGSGNVNAKIKDVSKDALKSWLGLGSLAYSSSSIPTKISQLTNDEGFITGYTLPTASADTLGGIKTGLRSSDATKWAIEVDDDGKAYIQTKGLIHNSNNVVAGLTVGISNTASYNATNILIHSQEDSDYNLYFPKKSGTFALTSDLSFNFVNSINDCQSGKINFFLNRDISNVDIDLKNFENCEEGTILLLSANNPAYGNIRITNSAHTWYYRLEPHNANGYVSTIAKSTLLITIKSGEIYVFAY